MSRPSGVSASPVAAIDCGTNTIKLLIGRPTVHGMEDLVREARMVRLGQGVDATGELHPDALERTFAAIDEYAALIVEHGVAHTRFVATSATRDADNAQTFVDGVRDRLGIEPEVVAGTEEAALAFDGCVRNLREHPPLPVLVVDIGGGSTELIEGSSLDTGPEAAHSMQIGSVRLHERHLRSDPRQRTRWPPASATSTPHSTTARSIRASPRRWSGSPAPSPSSPPASST